MGIEISRIDNEDIKALAYRQYDTNNNGILEGDELSLFKTSEEMSALSSESFNEIMGLNITTTNPIKTTNKSEGKVKPDKDLEKLVKNDVKNLVKTLRPSELMAELRASYTDPKYAEILNTVETLLNAVNATGYNSKGDVDGIKKKVKQSGFDKMSKFEQEILDSLVKQAKDEQILKEVNILKGLYKEVVDNAKEEDKNNTTKLLKELETKMEEKGYKGKSYFSKEAFNEFKVALGKEVKEDYVEKLPSTETTKRGKIKKELFEGVDKKDKFTKNVIKNKMKTELEIAARHNKFEDRKEYLTSISEKDLRKKLGNELFTKLTVNSRKPDGTPNNEALIIPNSDGTFDASNLSDKVLYRVGYDYELNRSKDIEMSEMKNLKEELKDLTNGQTFNDGDVKKILKLVDIKREGKTRNIGKALLNAIVPGMAGATGALISSNKLDVTQKVNIKIDDANTAKEMADALISAGVKPEVSTDALGNTTIKILQRVLIDNRILNILGGFGIGYLQGVAMSLIFGEDKAFEKSCISISDSDVENNRYTDPEEFKAYIKGRYPKAKADQLELLANVFTKEDGKIDVAAFQSQLNNIAGVGSNINCKEMTGAKIYGPKPQPQRPENNNSNGNPIQNNGNEQNEDQDCEIEYQDFTIPESETQVDTTYTHNRKSGDTWGGIVNAYYPCLVDKYGLSGAISKLKKALAYDKNDNFDANIYRHLLKDRDLPKQIDLPDSIDGCPREINDVKKVKIQYGRGKGSSLDKAGRRSSKTETTAAIPRWRAVNCEGRDGWGATPEEAAADIK